MNNLRALRVLKNKKASALAEALGVTPKHYYDLETGKRRLNVDHLQVLASELGVSSNEILAKELVIDNLNDIDKTVEDILRDPDNRDIIIVLDKVKKKGMSIETLEKLVDLYNGKRDNI
jgi:transcriptional regulator with XRE-family HTH domain